jgi:large subunit ribosomal protein L29
MKTKEIREKNDEALEHELRDQQKHLFDLRSQAVTEKLEDPSQLLKVRRDIARMKTILRQRQLEGQPKDGNGAATKSDESRAARKAAPKADKKAVRKKKTVRRTVVKAKKKAAKPKKAAASK